MNQKYTDEHKQYIRDNVTGRHFPELTEMFNKQFDTDYKETTIKSLVYRLGLKTGLSGITISDACKATRFKKGQIPWNKGKPKSWVGGEETQFKKGHIPVNHRQVGSERVNVDGYTEIKVAEPNKWRLKHNVIWEQHNGPIPKGSCVLFGDANKQNLDINNLILVSRKQLVRLNQNGSIQNDVELTKTGIMIADVISKIGERKKGEAVS